MKNFILIVILIQIITLSSCPQESLPPGYRWDLFKNTKNWELAKAVSNEDTSLIYQLFKDSLIDVNMQAGRFGRTLLMLAVGNDKTKSTEALLKMKADVNLRDFTGDQAIHEAVSFIGLRHQSDDILQLLLKYNANVNSVSFNGTISVPLEGAVDNLACAKLLLAHGANLYFKKDNSYPVWINLLISDNTDKIYVGEYVIVDMKFPIPKLIFNSKAINNPLTIFDILAKSNFTNDSKKNEARDKILSYLHKINFSNKGVYKEKL